MPANMKCSIDYKTADILQSNSYFYAMHRFGDTYEFVKHANKAQWGCVSISVGVKKEDVELLNKIKREKLNINYITIDIAHGHSHLMVEMIKNVKDTLPEVFLIAGNVATPEAYALLARTGADAVKVGIGQGAACTTKLQTGFTLPMFTCVQKIKESRITTGYTASIIADGGVKHNGDIAKAIVAGADWVMSGKLFAQCVDSPAPVDERGSKVYYGSASSLNKAHTNHIEGKSMSLTSASLGYLEKLKEIEQSLQSSISYSGGVCLADLAKSEWVYMTAQ
jgi:GMP reductase